MPTKNPRFNITMNSAEATLLASLAKQEKKSISLLAKELIWEALERREDLALSTLADAREEEAAKKSQILVTHEDAWK